MKAVTSVSQMGSYIGAFISARNQIQYENKKGFILPEVMSRASEIVKFQRDEADKKRRANSEKRRAMQQAQTEEDSANRITAALKKVNDEIEARFKLTTRLHIINERVKAASAEIARAQNAYGVNSPAAASAWEKSAKLRIEQIDLEDKALKEKQTAEDKLQNLYKERKTLIDDINQKTKDASKALQNLMSKGSGGTASKAKRAQTEQEKADAALASGHYNDYFRHTDRAAKLRQEAEDKRKGNLERRGADALKRGDMKTYNRLKEQYEKEGFGKKKPDEKLTQTDKNIAEMKKLIKTLVDGIDKK
jgi:hypothetical protein